MRVSPPIRNGIAAVIALAVVAVVVVLITSSGGSQDNAKAGDSASSGAKSGGAIAGGTLTAATPQPIDSLDVLLDHAAEPGSRIVAKNVFDSLVTQNGASGVSPSLATSWTNPTPKEWEFKLRTAQFSDGTPVTANDVKASWEASKKSASPYAPLWASVDDITAVDEHTVRVRTKAPLATMLPSLTLLPIAPASKVGDKDFAQHPVGSGPFMVKSYVPSQTLALVPNPHYWGPKPKLSELTLRYIPEDSSRVTALLNGEIQMTWAVPPEQMNAISGNPGTTLKTAPSTSYYAAWFNQGRKPFNDPRVRQALWHALDIPALAKAFFPTTATVATSAIPSTVFGYSKQTPYSYDPALAKKLLAEAGYPHGFSFEILWAQGLPESNQLMSAMASDWAKIGVKAKLNPEDRAPWLNDLLALKWDMLVDFANVATGDAGYTISRLYNSASKRFGYTKAPTLDPVLIASDQALDPDQRKADFAKADRIIWNQAYAIFLTEHKQIYAWAKTVSGIATPPDSTPVFTTAAVTKGST